MLRLLWTAAIPISILLLRIGTATAEPVDEPSAVELVDPPKPIPMPPVDADEDYAVAPVHSDCECCGVCVVYRGKPAPDAEEQTVFISRPCGHSIMVPVCVPEKATKRTGKDGNVRFRSDRRTVHLTWTSRHRLVVRYAK